MMAEPEPSGFGWRRTRAAAINRDHRHVAFLADLDRHHPALARYCLAKALLLDEDQLLDADAALINTAQAFWPERAP
jgi:hypothetical protein